VAEKKIIMTNTFAKMGATFYVLWGLLHIEAARKVYLLGQSLEPGMIQGRIFQVAWTLLAAALIGIFVGIFLNWKNNRLGYWLNLTVVSFTDIGFIVAVLIPGYIALVPGALGPVLWILALAFSTLAAKGVGHFGRAT